MCFRSSSKGTNPNPLIANRPTLSGLICAVSLEILNHHHNSNFTSYHFSSLPPAAANDLFVVIGKWTDTKMTFARKIWHMTL